MILGHSFAHPAMAFVLDAGIVRIESIVQDLATAYSCEFLYLTRYRNATTLSNESESDAHSAKLWFGEK